MLGILPYVVVIVLSIITLLKLVLRELKMVVIIITGYNNDYNKKRRVVLHRTHILVCTVYVDLLNVKAHATLRNAISLVASSKVPLQKS